MKGVGKVSPTTIRLRILKGTLLIYIGTAITGFTHHDPFEDTESDTHNFIIHVFSLVSPTTIRLRILKVATSPDAGHPHASFTHHDPFEDTERERSSTDGTSKM